MHLECVHTDQFSKIVSKCSNLKPVSKSNMPMDMYYNSKTINFYQPDLNPHLHGQALQYQSQHLHLCFTLWYMLVAYLSSITNV